LDTKVTTTVDPARCIGCGACVDVCPYFTLELRGGKAVVTGKESINCGHCAAVCPQGAITVGALDLGATRFQTFEADPRWLPPGEADLAALVRLMASRRSCRSFKNAPVARAALEDLARIGATAPSGTNSQSWTFTILPDRSAVMALGERTSQFFELLNRLSEYRALRVASRLLGRPELEQYHERYHDRVADGLVRWRRGERERLFHGATAAILIGSRPGASTPVEDAMLAAQNVLLAAHAMGLGSCLIGFVTEAIRRDPRIRRALRLERGERIHAVVALGHPAEAYERLAGRKPIPIRSWNGGSPR
jgi:nitroreductase/NAD-dependent dihydropyrimidine dehydrogenase PreA subunit